MMENSPQHTSELVLRERLRQASLSFNLAFSMTTAAAIVSLIGIALMFNGNAQAGAVTTTGGAAVSACCLKLAKDANDRLDKIVPELEE